MNPADVCELGLVICVDVKECWCQHRSLRKVILLSAPLAFPSVHFNKETAVFEERLYDVHYLLVLCHLGHLE